MFPYSETIDGYLVECSIEGNPIPKSHLIPRKYVQNKTITIFENSAISKEHITVFHTQEDKALISSPKQTLNLVLPND